MGLIPALLDPENLGEGASPGDRSTDLGNQCLVEIKEDRVDQDRFLRRRLTGCA